MFLSEYLKKNRLLLLSTKFVRPYPNDSKNEAALLEKISIVVRNTMLFILIFFSVDILKCDKNHENAFRVLKNFPGEKPPDPRSGAVRFAHTRMTGMRPFRFLAFFKLNPALLLLILQ